MQSRSYVIVFLTLYLIYLCAYYALTFSSCNDLELPLSISIQDMINKAKDGDVVPVPPGTYVENIRINKSIKLVAEGVVNILPLDPNTHVVEVISDNVTLQGFSIKGPVGVLKSGIYVGRASRCHILSNNVFNCSYFGIYVVDSRDILLSGNLVTSSEFGIYIFMSRDGAIVNNDLSLNKYGLTVSECSNITVRKDSLENNIFGVYLHSSNFNYVTENVINFNQRAISVISSQGNEISSNEISNNNYGVLVDSSRDNKIFENVFLDDKIGIYIFNSEYNTIFKNNISYGDNNVYAEKSRDLLISNNSLRFAKNSLVIDFCHNVSALQNLLENALGNGLTSFRSEGCRVIENSLRLNKIGISLDSSANYTIDKNLIELNEYGIYLHHSSDNLILRNRCLRNSVAAFYSDGVSKDNIIRNLEVNSCNVLTNLTFSYFGEISINELRSVQGANSNLRFLGACFNFTILTPRSWMLINLSYNPSDLVGSGKSAPSLYLWTGAKWEPATESTSLSLPDGRYISTRLKEPGTYAMLVELPATERGSSMDLYFLSATFALVLVSVLFIFRKRILKSIKSYLVFLRGFNSKFEYNGSGSSHFLGISRR